MSDIERIGGFGEKSSTLYICACNSHVFMIEALEHQEGHVMSLRCWGCGRVHTGIKITDEYEEDDEE